MKKNLNRETKIVRFNQDNFSLDIKISPKEQTVWMNQNEIAVLFETTQENVSMHIVNIYKSLELESEATHKDFLLVQREGKRQVSRLISYYNLDMILALGYRINSKRAIAFRKWASEILSQYLFKGYAIDNRRIVINPENYLELINKVISIDNKMNSIDDRVTLIEEKYKDKFHEMIIKNGQVFDGVALLQEMCSSSQSIIILEDPYIDAKALDILKAKNNNTKALIITSNKSRLSDREINLFNRQYSGLIKVVDNSFHDRYLIIDFHKVYHLGASINYLGKKISQIDEVLNEDSREFLFGKIRKYVKEIK